MTPVQAFAVTSRPRPVKVLKLDVTKAMLEMVSLGRPLLGSALPLASGLPPVCKRPCVRKARF